MKQFNQKAIEIETSSALHAIRQANFLYQPTLVLIRTRRTL